jgi:septal ring factor EnvC (AmiA/AmiB activator)
MPIRKKAARRDPWDTVLSRHVSSHRSEPDPSPGVQPDTGISRRALAIILSSIIVVLLASAGALGWVAIENRERGESWQQRSQALTELVEDRTQALNRQTARLNAAATRLRAARRAIARSEADVENLERRQTELAAEKAELEDQRALLEAEGQALRERGQELEGVAGFLIECNSATRAVLETVLRDFYPSDYEVSQLQSSCSAAESAIANYVSRYE